MNNPKENQNDSSKLPAHDKPQRDDQPLKKMNDPAGSEKKSGDGSEHDNHAQGDHAGSSHTPDEFDQQNPEV